MAKDEATARRFGYGALTPDAPKGAGRMVPRPAVVAVVDYESGDRFSPAQDSFVEEFFNPYVASAGAMLDRFGGRLYRVGGNGMPPIVKMSAADYKAPENVRVNLVAQRLVDDVFGPKLFTDHRDLVVICADNFGPDGGANRGAHASLGAAAGLDFRIAFFAQHASLQTRLHEVLHTLGAIDVYGHDAQRNVRHSLMSSTEGAGGRATKLPDPWHRMAWRLTQPDVREIGDVVERKQSVDIEIASASGGDYPAILLWNPARAARECFIVELRNHLSSHNQLLVDSDTAPGFVVWSLMVGEDGIPVLRPAGPGVQGNDRAILTVASPSLELGGWDAWCPTGGTTTVATPELRWLDGTPAGFSLDMELARPDVYDAGTVHVNPVFDMVAQRRPAMPGYV